MTTSRARGNHAIGARAIEVKSNQAVSARAKTARRGHTMKKSLVRIPIDAEGIDVGREVVLAEPTLNKACYCLRSIPAFAYGLAFGDTVKIVEPSTGKFEVITRGGQVTIRVFVAGSLVRPDVRALIDSVVLKNGKYEVGKDDGVVGGASLLLVSLDVRLGFSVIESLLHVVEGPDVKWEYGNVYDANGEPLNWWVQ